MRFSGVGGAVCAAASSRAGVRAGAGLFCQQCGRLLQGLLLTCCKHLLTCLCVRVCGQLCVILWHLCVHACMHAHLQSHKYTLSHALHAGDEPRSNALFGESKHACLRLPAHSACLGPCLSGASPFSLPRKHVHILRCNSMEGRGGGSGRYASTYRYDALCTSYTMTYTPSAGRADALHVRACRPSGTAVSHIRSNRGAS